MGLVGEIRPCESCGKLFQPKSTGKGATPNLYCSQQCFADDRWADAKTRIEKACSGCGVIKPLEAFHVCNRNLDGRQSQCKDCHSAIQSDRAFLRFGITREQYDEILEAQGGVCAICKEVCNSGRRLAVDHDHETGEVRGLLCGNCNTAIGKFHDNTDYLRAAIAYLENS